MRSMPPRHPLWTLLTLATSILACGSDKGPTQPASPVLSMSRADSLTMPRVLHTATLLNNGMVLIAGGVNEVTAPWRRSRSIREAATSSPLEVWERFTIRRRLPC
jgi:hypothetical protein